MHLHCETAADAVDVAFLHVDDDLAVDLRIALLQRRDLDWLRKGAPLLAVHVNLDAARGVIDLENCSAGCLCDMLDVGRAFVRSFHKEQPAGDGLAHVEISLGQVER